MSKRRTITEETLKDPMMTDRLGYMFHNMTGHFPEDRPCRALLKELERFAKKAATLGLKNPSTRPDVTGSNGKQLFANKMQARVMEYDVQELIMATRLQLLKSFPNLVRDYGRVTEYDFTKTAYYAVAISCMIVHGLKPSTLRCSDEESAAHMIRVAEAIAASGTPSTVVIAPV